MTHTFSVPRRFISGVYTAVLFAAPVVPIPTRADGNRVSIDDVVTAALNHSILVREIEATSASKKAEAFETRALPNPELATELAVPTSWEETRGRNELNVSIVQPLRLSHGRPRNRLAALIEAAGTAEKERTLLEFVTRVRLAFARSWVLSERSTTLERLLPRARSLYQLVKTGLGEGAYGKGDDALFRAEIFKTEAEIKGLIAEMGSAVSELSRLSGSSFATVTLLAPRLPVLPSADEFERRLDHSETKLQSRSHILLKLAQAADEVTRRDAFPELRPRLFYARTNEGVDLVGAGISFDLPFWSRNTAEKLRSDASLKTAQVNRALADSETFKRSVLDEVRSYAARRDELLLYQEKILPLLREALDATEQQVRNGTGSIFQLWQTLREYAETHEQYLELWTKTFSAHVELSVLLEEEI